MKIAIEAQRIFRKNKHGMDFVALETIRHLQEIDITNEYYIFVKPGQDECLKSTRNFHVIKLNCPTYFLWEQVALPLAIRRLKPDLLHCTSNTAPIWGETPLVVTLHDIIFLEKTSGINSSLYQRLGRLYRKWIVPVVVSRSKTIITVSDYEKKRIQDRFPAYENKIIRVYNGLNPRFNPTAKDTSIVSKYTSDPSYLFFLGNTDPKKNTVGVLKAYAIYLQKSAYKRKLLIADLQETQIDSLLKQEKIQEIKPYLIFTGYISNTDLPALYASAFVFLYPSLRESFGLPLLEAMACGTPVISSDTSAIPEIAGEKIDLVPPDNVIGIADKLIILESFPEYYKGQVYYGITRSKLFSWKKTAAKIYSIYINKHDEF